MTTDSKTQDSAPSEAQKTGRGGLAIAAGKVYFMVLGLGQQIALKAVLGLSGFGAYSTASSVASISYNPIVQTAIQGVSREVSGASEAERPGIIRSALGCFGRP